MPGLFRPLQKLFDICFNIDGEEPSAVSLERFPVRADEELLKVPGDVIPVHRTPDDEFGITHQGHRVVTGLRQLLLEEHKQRVGVRTVHFQLLQKLEFWLKAISRTDVLQRQQNFIVLAVLLLSNQNCTICYAIKQITAFVSIESVSSAGFVHCHCY